MESQEKRFEFNLVGGREPQQRSQDGNDVTVFMRSHQDPGNAVLVILELLEIPARDPNEGCVIVV